MMKPTQNKNRIVLIIAVALVYVLAIVVYTQGVPQGATVTHVSNDSGPSSSVGQRDDQGGTIVTLTLDSTQQNFGWKAYVGNVTGTLTLDDASSNTIYQWPQSTSPSGEVYVSRDNNVDWTSGSIVCADSATILTEQGVIGGLTTDVDSINNTYNYSQHGLMQVGVNAIGADSCRTTYTYQGDAAQIPSSSANFTSILLEDSGNDGLVYGTFIEDNLDGFNSASTYDFQIIVPDNDTAAIITYYFYLEIGS